MKIKRSFYDWNRAEPGLSALTRRKHRPNPTEKVLWGHKRGTEEWAEDIISTQPAKFEAAKIWAAERGYHRFRVSTTDLSKPPDFAGTVRRNPGYRYTPQELFVTVRGKEYRIPNWSNEILNENSKDFRDRARNVSQTGAEGRRLYHRLMDEATAWRLAALKDAPKARNNPSGRTQGSCRQMLQVIGGRDLRNLHGFVFGRFIGGGRYQAFFSASGVTKDTHLPDGVRLVLVPRSLIAQCATH